jgi:hypothetical protein
MGRAIVIAAVAALSAGFAVAAPAPAVDEAAAMADFFKGTLEIDNLAGQWSARRWLAPDHTYREVGSDGEVHGAWKIESGKICTTADHKLGLDRAATYCNVGVGKTTGESWKDTDPVTGNVVLFKLSPGRG